MSVEKVALITAGGSGMGAGAAKSLPPMGSRSRSCRPLAKAKHWPKSLAASVSPAPTSRLMIWRNWSMALWSGGGAWMCW